MDERCRAAGSDSQACFDLKLAVDEACTNIVMHGYSEGARGRMAVAIGCDGDRMTVTIRDSGRRFDPASISAPDLDAALDDREPGGLGWHLIRASVDEFRYESDTSGNRLTLVKSVRVPGKH